SCFTVGAGPRRERGRVSGTQKVQLGPERVALSALSSGYLKVLELRIRRQRVLTEEDPGLLVCLRGGRIVVVRVVRHLRELHVEAVRLQQIARAADGIERKRFVARADPDRERNLARRLLHDRRHLGAQDSGVDGHGGEILRLHPPRSSAWIAPAEWPNTYIRRGSITS